MKKLIIILAMTLGIGLFAPQAQAGHRHYRDCGHSVRYYSYRDYDDYRGYRGYRSYPRVRYYRPAYYYSCPPRYYSRPRVSFSFGF